MKYDDFISICTSKLLLIQYELNQVGIDKDYSLYAYDENIKYKCNINNVHNVTDVADFEDNYKDISNKPVKKVDDYSRIPIFRPLQVDANIALNYLYFTTGNTNSFDTGGNTLWTMSTPNTTTTKLRFAPNFVYYLEGGYLKMESEPTAPMKVDVILAPDVSQENGGSWPFIKNKKLCGTTCSLDVSVNVSPKHIEYYPELPGLSFIDIIITHAENESVDFEALLLVYI